MSGQRRNGRSPRGGGPPPQGRTPQNDQPEEQDEDLQREPQEEEEFSLEPNPGAARGRRDKVTPALVVFREGEEGEEVNWRRELNLREAQIRTGISGPHVCDVRAPCVFGAPCCALHQNLCTQDFFV